MLYFTIDITCVDGSTSSGMVEVRKIDDLGTEVMNELDSQAALEADGLVAPVQKITITRTVQ